MVMAVASVASEASAATPPAPWFGSGYNAAFSHDNLTESIITPTTVKSMGCRRAAT